jgi:hypothetical protein
MERNLSLIARLSKIFMKVLENLLPNTSVTSLKLITLQKKSPTRLVNSFSVGFFHPLVITVAMRGKFLVADW